MLNGENQIRKITNIINGGIDAMLIKTKINKYTIKFIIIYGAFEKK
jgi:hypothetical protein